MKRCISFLLAIVALAGAASLVFPPLPLSAQTKATATNVPVIPHESVPNFFKNPPGIYTGAFPSLPHREWQQVASQMRRLRELGKRVAALEHAMPQVASNSAEPNR